jgi:spore coat protein U-like protein
MKIANTLFATVAVLAIAGPAFSQTLLTTPSSTGPVAVTTTIVPACALTGTLSPFSMTVSPNGAVTTAAAAQPITVTCNTPNGNVSIGSEDMVNLGAPDIIETATFTNVIKFVGQADGLTGGDAWTLDSRTAAPFADAATIGFNTDRRIRTLSVSIEGAAPADGKLPVAGAYAGTVCVTVDPAGLLSGNGTTNNDGTCAATL